MDFRSMISGLANRFKEPSSWASLTGMCALLHISVDPGLASSIALAGAGVCGVIAFFLPEKKS